MAIQVQGNGGVVADVDGTSYRSLRVVNRPLDAGAFGHYGLRGQSGTMAAGLAADAEVFQFRWTDATRLGIIEEVRFDGAGSIAAFAAGFYKFDLVIARSWTADGSGGTGLTPTGNANKLRTSFGTTLLGAARIASTAILTLGTKTLDAQAVGSIMGGLTATAGASMPPDIIFRSEGGTQHPLILAQNEGFVIRATVPATGTWTFGISVKWSEFTSF